MLLKVETGSQQMVSLPLAYFPALVGSSSKPLDREPHPRSARELPPFVSQHSDSNILAESHPRYTVAKDLVVSIPTPRGASSHIDKRFARAVQQRSISNMHSMGLCEIPVGQAHRAQDMAHYLTLLRSSYRLSAIPRTSVGQRGY